MEAPAAKKLKADLGSDEDGKNKDLSNQEANRREKIPVFLSKTFEIFSNEENSDICGFGDSGNSIVIRKVPEFCSILPQHFKHENLQSFVRQLNMYDFHKTAQDTNNLEFQHTYFRKGRADLLHLIRRKTSDPRNRIPQEQKDLIINNKASDSIIEQSDTILQELVELREWRAKVQDKLSALEHDNKKMVFENDLLWQSLQQHAVTQRNLQTKMQKILFFMYDMFLSSGGAHRELEAPGGAAAAGDAQLEGRGLTHLGDAEFFRRLEVLGIDAPLLQAAASQADAGTSAALVAAVADVTKGRGGGTGDPGSLDPSWEKVLSTLQAHSSASMPDLPGVAGPAAPPGGPGANAPPPSVVSAGAAPPAPSGQDVEAARKSLASTEKGSPSGSDVSLKMPTAAMDERVQGSPDSCGGSLHMPTASDVDGRFQATRTKIAKIEESLSELFQADDFSQLLMHNPSFPPVREDQVLHELSSAARAHREGRAHRAAHGAGGLGPGLGGPGPGGLGGLGLAGAGNGGGGGGGLGLGGGGGLGLGLGLGGLGAGGLGGLGPGPPLGPGPGGLGLGGPSDLLAGGGGGGGLGVDSDILKMFDRESASSLGGDTGGLGVAGAGQQQDSSNSSGELQGGSSSGQGGGSSSSGGLL